MSDNPPERASSAPNLHPSADDIIRSILNDHTSTRSEISPTGELYRAIERFHARARRSSLVNSARRDLVRSTLNRWASASASASTSASPSAAAAAATTASSRSPSRNSMSSDARSNSSESRRRFSREPQPPNSSTSLPPLRSLTASRRPTAMSASGSSNPSGRSGRWRASERYPERNRNATPGQATAGDDQADYALQMMLLEQQQQTHRSRTGRGDRGHHQTEGGPTPQRSHNNDANGQLRTLLGFNSTHGYSELSFPSPPLPFMEMGEEGRRVKRRKLDSDRLATGFRGFRYGRFGQVEPGVLTMEMVSCDGGIYSDDGTSYAAENILKNDATVYCTKGPRCNIVLRHQGATAFTLKELVIKAPRSNYTSPVQEGMVFVSMNSDDLLARTAQYQIQYAPPRSASRRSERDTPLAPIISVRHNDDGSTMTRPQARARRIYNIGLDDEDNDFRVAQLPSEFTVTSPPFRVTTDCSDDEADDVLPRSERRTPNRIGSLPFESWSSDEDGQMEDFGLIRHHRRSRHSGLADLEPAAVSPSEVSSEARQVSGGEMMAPLARFFIERNKSKCTVRFDPPVSGRFILLKMWSPHRDPTANIDIQAVIAKGFAGPRYFPAVELR